MGNASSSGRGHHEETVDFGYLTPQGIYTGPRDWNQAIVTQLIVDRKLAPFYRPLEDYDESWDDEKILAAMKEPPQVDGAEADSALTRAESSSLHSSSSRTHHKRPSTAAKETPRIPEAGVYRGAAECPICFLYYPPNINHSRCCDQAICTECFVQIKRADPTTTHLVSEPASCPYCVQENFGVVYTPPPWRAGINSEGYPAPSWTTPGGQQSSPTAALQRRRKSFGADNPDVVTIDQIRPDWEAKLAAVRAAVARRANRRIIMRQVGDRLIPVGISSGRIHALQPEDLEGQNVEGGSSSERGSRRSRRRNQNPELNQYLGQTGFTGQDLEELMVMEAMRLSLIEHEEQERKRKEEEEKKKREGGNAAQSAGNQSAGESSTNAPAENAPSGQLSPGLLSPDSVNTGGSNSPTTRHRSSSSLSGRSRRSPSPAGVIGAAMRSATSAASAVGSPPADHDIPPSLTPPAGSAGPSAPAPAAPTADLSSDSNGTVGTVTVTPPEGEQHPASEDQDPARMDQTPTTATRPLPIERNTSFSSSIAPEGSTYDYLPSSPGSSTSSLAQKPLLDSPSAPPQVPGAVEGGSSSAAAHAE